MRLYANRNLSTGLALVCSLLVVAGSSDVAHGIEMFTFFGDGSRIGLPSLEVPVEAYPGIPLRSDRIRMRTGRFARWRGGARQSVAQPPNQSLAQPIQERPEAERRPAGGVRIRPMEAEARELPVAPMPPE